MLIESVSCKQAYRNHADNASGSLYHPPMRVSPGEAIAAALARNGLTQAGFAKRMRVSEATVSRWVSGETFPRPRRMKVICDVLGLSPEQIFAGFELDKDVDLPSVRKPPRLEGGQALPGVPSRPLRVGGRALACARVEHSLIHCRCRRRTMQCICWSTCIAYALHRPVATTKSM